MIYKSLCFISTTGLNMANDLIYEKITLNAVIVNKKKSNFFSAVDLKFIFDDEKLFHVRLFKSGNISFPLMTTHFKNIIPKREELSKRIVEEIKTQLGCEIFIRNVVHNIHHFWYSYKCKFDIAVLKSMFKLSINYEFAMINSSNSCLNIFELANKCQFIICASGRILCVLPVVPLKIIDTYNTKTFILNQKQKLEKILKELVGTSFNPTILKKVQINYLDQVKEIIIEI